MKKKNEHLKLVKNKNKIPFWKKAARFIVRVTVILAFLTLLFYAELFFRVEQVEVEGNSELSSDEVINAGEIEKGMSIILLQENVIAEKIERQEPRAKNVKVNRKLPDTLTVAIEERKPAAYVMTADGFWIIDKNAVPFEYAREANQDYPLISGIDGSLVIPGAPIDCSVRQEVLEAFFAAWPGETGLEAEKLDLRASYNLIVHTIDEMELWLGDDEDMDHKLELIKNSMPYLDREENFRLDVRCGKRLIVSSSVVKEEEKGVDP
ncbi:MAG: FtsQ-type POTRA domain-containing protein [Bacillota bacterium]